MFGFRRNSSLLIILFCLPLVFFLFRSIAFQQYKFKIVHLVKIPNDILSWPIREFIKFISYRDNFSQRRKLARENEVLKTRLIATEELVRENQRLQKLLSLKRQSVYSSVGASVIGRDPSYWNSVLLIDKGAQDGVKMGQVVVNASGVIGKIIEVGQRLSKVVLLVDPSFSVAAVIAESRESGLVSGTLQGVCRMRYLRADADIQPGYKVLTSRISSSFPENLLIGYVAEVLSSTDGVSRECIIKPAASISRVEEVLVILE